MTIRTAATWSVAFVAALLAAASETPAQGRRHNAVIDLWRTGTPAFGVFVPNEKPVPRGEGGAAPADAPPRPTYTKEGGERLAANPLYDFVFLNLEGCYDPAAVVAIVEGLRSSKSASRKTLIVRIPPIERHGADAARARVKESLDLGADGVAIPHVRSVDEAKQAIGFFQQAKADVWSASNPRGETLAMLMIEDPGALAQLTPIADLEGYSILACGIGSLTAALNGDRDAAEAGNQKVLAETKRVKLVNMLTASAQDVEKRVKEGFLALIAQGRTPDEVIAIGRAAAGR